MVSMCVQKSLDMRHSGKLSRREVLQNQAPRSASKVQGGACPSFFVMLLWFFAMQEICWRRNLPKLC